MEILRNNIYNILDYTRLPFSVGKWKLNQFLRFLRHTGGWAFIRLFEYASDFFLIWQVSAHALLSPIVF